MGIIKILMIEDNPDDAELVRFILEEEDWDLEFQVVDQQTTLIEALNESWDLVISDYALPSFNGLDALRIVKDKDPDLPFIIISGTIGEDLAVNAMRAGAHDYMMKNNLTRLIPAIRRELEEAKHRSEKRKAKEELKKREREKEILLKNLKEKTRELEEIIFISSHDLRSPLVNIEGFTKEMVLSCKQIQELIYTSLEDRDIIEKVDTIFNRDIASFVSIVSENVQKMNSLLQDLIILSNLEHQPLHLQVVDMNTITKTVIQSKEKTINQCKAAVIQENLPNCYTDPDKTQIILSHLLDNALQYLDPERTGSIRITGRQKGKYSVYSISDNGIGIRPEYHDQIFDIFHQLNPNPANSSSGFGLTVVRRQIHRLQGKIEVDSRPNEGSCFSFYVPATENDIVFIENDKSHCDPIQVQ